MHYYDVLAFELREKLEPGSNQDYRAMCTSQDRGIAKVTRQPDWVTCPECLGMLAEVLA